MRAVSVTNRGGRENNEDFISHAHEGKIWCYVLCDGLGGHDDGEIASKTVAEAACAEFKKKPEITPEAVRAYLDGAAKALEKEREENASTMSTTAALLVTDGESAVWGHIGDSRIYYIEQGEISTITDDHSVAFMEFESGMITYDEIRTSVNQNRLTRCVGGFGAFTPDISEVAEVKKGDAFLMCSDGFWELVHEKDMEKTLAASKTSDEWLEEMLKILHKNETDYNDNYSAVAIMI